MSRGLYQYPQNPQIELQLGYCVED